MSLCNLCGMQWPNHASTCSYAINVMNNLKMRHALLEYGRHKSTCAIQNPTGPKGPCDCGLQVILKDIIHGVAAMSFSYTPQKNFPTHYEQPSVWTKAALADPYEPPYDPEQAEQEWDLYDEPYEPIFEPTTGMVVPSFVVHDHINSTLPAKIVYKNSDVTKKNKKTSINDLDAHLDVLLPANDEPGAFYSDDSEEKDGEFIV